MTELASYTGSNCTASTEGSFRKFVVTGASPYAQSPTFSPGLPGHRCSIIRIALKRMDSAPSGSIRILYDTPGHGYSSTYDKTVAIPSGKAAGEIFLLEFDMSALDGGGTDYVDSVIDGIRIAFPTGVGAEWMIHSVGFGAKQLVPGKMSQDATVNTDTVTPNAITETVMVENAVDTTIRRANGLPPPDNADLLVEHTFSLSKIMDVLVSLTITINFQDNNYGWIYILIDASPVFDGVSGEIINAHKRAQWRASNNVETGNSMSDKLSSLSVGSHTVSVWGQSQTVGHIVTDTTMVLTLLKTET